MKRSLVLLTFALLTALPAAAQQTVVTATVKDPNGIPYANGTVQASLQISGGPATVTISNQAQCSAASAGTAPCQIPIAGNVGPTTLDSTGTFVMTLYSNTSITPASSKWLFTINISPGIPLPLGTGPQTFSVAVTVTGATQNLSSTLSAAAPALTNYVSGGGFPAACPLAVSPQILFDNAGACGSIAGSAVTAATGATTLTATGDTVTPLTISSTTGTQTAGLLNITNGFTDVCQGQLCVNGLGAGMIQGNPALLDLATNDNNPWNLVLRNAMAGAGMETVSYVDNTGALSFSNPFGELAFVSNAVQLEPSGTNEGVYVLGGNGAGGQACLGNINGGSGDYLCVDVGPFAQIGTGTGVGQLLFNDPSHPNTGPMVQFLGGGPGTNYDLNLPTSAGAAGTVLTSQGGGSNPMTWSTFTAFTSITNCGTTAACGNTAVSAPRALVGTAPITASANETITGISPAFASSTSYVCTLGEQGTGSTLSNFSVTNVSGSSFTIVTQGAAFTGVVGYHCIGN